MEDEETLRIVIDRVVTGMGYAVDSTGSVNEAQRLHKANSYLAAFYDIRLPDGDGLSLLSWTAKNARNCNCVIMTAEATMNNAIQAVKKGAFEYLVKPFDIKEVEQIIGRIERRAAISSSSETESLPAPKVSSKFEIIGQSPAIQKLYRKIGKAAASSYTVLITGESGSGKELVARNLHDFSDRADMPFVTVNCSAIPSELMESELFGYVKGAFTGADRDNNGLLQEADGGTLFMDEICEINTKMQAKLLRLLEDGKITPLGSRKAKPVNVRFIAATNRDVIKMVEKKQFREDLYHRLNVIPIKVPSLRKRREDIGLLARYFVKRSGGGRRISDEACRALEERPWPGNVRQLLNAIKRALVMSSENVLQASQFQIVEEEAPGELEAWIARNLQKGGKDIHKNIVSRVEAELIRQALEKCGQNKIKAARLLGINRNTLTKKVKDYSLE